MKRYIPTSWEFTKNGKVVSSLIIRGDFNQVFSGEDITEKINHLCETGEIVTDLAIYKAKKKRNYGRGFWYLVQY